MTGPAEDTPYSPTGLPDVPVGLFGCTIRQVGALVRTIEILAEPASDRDPDLTITYPEVEAWIGQLSDTLTARLTGLPRIQPGDTRTALLTAAADAVANGAASYIEAAAHPEQAAMADATSYAAVLWNRYTTAADQIAAAINTLIDGSGPDIGPDLRGPAAAWSFPPPALPDDKQW